MSWDTGTPPRRAPLSASNTQEIGTRGEGARWLQEQKRLQAQLKASKMPLFKISSTKVDEKGQQSTAPAGLPRGFPNVDVLDQDRSDRLFFPTQSLSRRSALRTLTKWASGQQPRVGAVADAETLLSAMMGIVYVDERWTPSQRQEVVKMFKEVGEPHQPSLTPLGPLTGRLKEIIRWSEVTHQTSKGKNHLSFQNCYMAVIAFATCEAVLNCQTSTAVSAIYATIHDNLARLLQVLNKNLTGCIAVRSFKSAAKGIIEVQSGLQVFWPVARLLQEYTFRCPDYSKVSLEAFVTRFEKHFNTWSTGISNGSFDDLLTKRSQEEKAFLLGKIEKKLTELRQALQSTENNFIEEEIAVDSSKGSQGEVDETVADSDPVTIQTEETQAEDVPEPNPTELSGSANGWEEDPWPVDGPVDQPVKAEGSTNDHGWEVHDPRSEDQPSEEGVGWDVDADHIESSVPLDPADGWEANGDSEWGTEGVATSGWADSITGARGGKDDGGWGGQWVDGDAATQPTRRERKPYGGVHEWTQSWSGPGGLRSEGPRHGNDHADFRKIRISPTADELLCTVEPYLPSTIKGLRHHLSSTSVERILDTHFRLLREDAFANFREGVAGIVDDLERGEAQLLDLIRDGGGGYSPTTSFTSSGELPLITNVKFCGVGLDKNYGLVIQVTADAPPGALRDARPKARLDFLIESARLGYGALVALITPSDEHKPTVSLAVVASNVDEIGYRIPPDDPTRPQLVVGISFIDPQEGLRQALNVRARPEGNLVKAVLLECPTMYEATRPFLQSLQAADPYRLPMARYLQVGGETTLSLPEYATKPGFTWDMKVLLKDDAKVRNLTICPSQPGSIEEGRKRLKKYGKLDPSPADAVIDSLTRELALIQGPPGTGKTFTGRELLRLLIDNNVGPILLMAVTNHALDHLLRSLHENGVTRSMLRLGTRTKDDVVARYLLSTAERQRKPDRKYREKLRAMEAQMRDLFALITAPWPTDAQVEEYLARHHPRMLLNLNKPPAWAKGLFEDHLKEGRHILLTSGQEPAYTLWTYWLRGYDLDHISGLESLNADGAATEDIPGSGTSVSFRFDKSTSVPQEQTAANNSVPYGRPIKAMPKVSRIRTSSSRKELSVKKENLNVEALIAQTTSRISGLNLEASDDFEIKREAGFRMGEPDDGLYDFMFAQPARSLTTPRWVQLGPLPAPFDQRGTLTSGQSIPTTRTQEEEKSESAEKLQAFLARFKLGRLPFIPATARSLEVLLDKDQIWSFSKDERARLSEYIALQAKKELEDHAIAPLKKLVEAYEVARKEFDQARQENLVDILKGVQVLGATTAGSAKLLSPEVIEEAGQVLEPHILAALHPTVQHVIALGDPEQLRPLINRYELSADSRKGGGLYRFDVSLMERLSQGGLPMSQLRVQRRMRPGISALIRQTIYPELQDHERVQRYPNVSGMGRNVFFLDHRHAESDGSQTQRTNKYNVYEVEMICSLVEYFLKQGVYDDGDVVVLCAYQGQLRKLNSALRGRVRIITDERDHRALHGLGGRTEVWAEGAIKSGRGVALRTIDNFQGEEAKIIILSLVRNEGEPSDQESGGEIGFLANTNRVNVALSRAQHGLYILCNAPQLSRKSQMWRTIIEELQGNGCLGSAWPLICARHRDVTAGADTPISIEELAPEGGCRADCGILLPCGHTCPSKCHPDQSEHDKVRCREHCRRRLACSHICAKKCYEDCGKCLQEGTAVHLPCGHAQKLQCWQLDRIGDVKCSTLVERRFDDCEHTIMIPCHKQAEAAKCSAVCAVKLDCCGKLCTAPCMSCTALSHGQERDRPPASSPNTESQDNLDHALARLKIDPESAQRHDTRTRHQAHPCAGVQPICGHVCDAPCEKSHVHPTCMKRCETVCAHRKCPNGCGEICSACEQQCEWSCEHQKCSMKCGIPCDRLPCDEPCGKKLKCGHDCPSLCGEPCRYQVCLICATPDELNTLVELEGKRTLKELISQSEEVTQADRLISMECGHTFTVDALDTHLDLDSVYDKVEGKWTGLKMPPSPTAINRPLCPRCARQITSPRYSRLVNRSIMLVQQQHARQALIREFEASSSAMSTTQSEAHVLQALTGCSLSLEVGMPDIADLNAMLQLRPEDSTLVDPVLFEDMQRFYRIEGPVSTVWQTLSAEKTRSYTSLVRLANWTYPFLEAFDKCFAKVYDTGQKAFRRVHGDGADRWGNVLSRTNLRMSVERPDAFEPLKFEAVVQSIRVRLELSALAANFAKVLKTTLPAVGSTRSATKAIAEAKALMARRFSILSWTFLKSCRRDLDMATNELMRQSKRKHGWNADAQKFRQIKAQVELAALISHFEVTRHVCLDRIAAFAAGTPGIVDQSVMVIKNERAVGMERWLRALRGLDEGREDGKAWIGVLVKLEQAGGEVLTQWRDFAESVVVGTTEEREFRTRSDLWKDLEEVLV